MSLEYIKKEMKRFLESKESEILCINGRWGSGKTFLWQSLISDAEPDRIGLPTYSYVSLFGVNSLKEFKYSIFENSETTIPSVKTAPDKAKEIGIFISNQAKKMVSKLGLKDLITGYIGDVSSLVFSTVKNTIICVDDLERKGEQLSVLEVLGLCSVLKETKGCKIVIILNDEKLKDRSQDFQTFLEKVIDVKFRFSPTVTECIQIGLTTKDDSSSQLGECCHQLGMDNIRVIKKIERLVVTAKQEINDIHEPEIIQQIIQTLALLGWTYYSDRPFYKYITEDLKLNMYGFRHDNLTDEQQKYQTKLADYSFHNLDDFDKCLKFGIENGYFETKLLREEAKNLQNQKDAERSSQSFFDAWGLYHNSFLDNADEVLNQIYVSFKENVSHLSVRDLNSSVEMLRKYGRSDEAGEIIDIFVNCKDRENKFWDLSQYNHIDPMDPLIIQKFNEKYLSSLPAMSARDILIKIANNNSWNPEDTALLAAQTAEDYYKLFKEENGEDLETLVRRGVTFGRIQGIGDYKIISDHITEALRKIAAETEMNEHRVQKFGIFLEKKSDILDN